MHHLFGLIAFAVALRVLWWLCVPSQKHRADQNNRQLSQPADLIDPNNDRQLAMLIGMSGGSIPDAAVARFALRRFEEATGKKPTTQDIGFIIGMVRELDLDP
jgi:hypothetical protein